LSVLSAAVLTGAKASNLPLLLPWAVAMAPTWRVWLVRPLALVAISVAAVGASFLPMAVLNAMHCGDWSGAAIEHVPVGSGPVWLMLFVNGTTWALENVSPPVFPFASAWSRAVEALTPGWLGALVQRHFENGAARWKLPEMQMEESAGLGFGITILLGLSLLAVVLRQRRRDRGPAARSGDRVTRWVCLAAWLSLLFVMTKLNLNGSIRYLASYYPLLGMGLLISPAQEEVIRRKWWRSWAFFSCGLAGLLLVISPARPLWPAEWFFQHYRPRLGSSELAARAIDTYEVYSRRAEAFAPVIAALPADASVLGFSARDFPETSLWKPFGSRRILHVKMSDSAEELRQRGLRYVLVTLDSAQESWPEWLQRMNARELRTETLRMWRSRPPFVWHLVELNPPDSGAAKPKPEPARRDDS
jgi:cytochrome b561